MLRSKPYRKRDTTLTLTPTATLGSDTVDEPVEGPMGGLDFDSHSFCHDPVYRRLLGELLAELEGEDDDSDEDDDEDDDRPLRPN